MTDFKTFFFLTCLGMLSLTIALPIPFLQAILGLTTLLGTLMSVIPILGMLMIVMLNMLRMVTLFMLTMVVIMIIMLLNPWNRIGNNKLNIQMLKTFHFRQDVGLFSGLSLEVLGTVTIAAFFGALARALNGGFEIELPKGFPIKRMGKLPDTAELKPKRRRN
jgi:hypothetical protein